MQTYVIQQDAFYYLYTGQSRVGKQYLFTAVKLDPAKRQRAVPSHVVMLEFNAVGNLINNDIEALPGNVTFSTQPDVILALLSGWATRLQITQSAVQIAVAPFNIPDYQITLTGDRDAIKAFTADTSSVEPDDLAAYARERERWLAENSCILMVSGNRFLLDGAGDVVAV